MIYKDRLKSRHFCVASISDSRNYLDRLMKNADLAATPIANSHGAEIADSFLD